MSSRDQGKLWQRNEKPNYRDDLLASFRTLRISSLDAFLMLWMRARKLRGAVAEDSLSGSSCFRRACQCSKSCEGKHRARGKVRLQLTVQKYTPYLPIEPFSHSRYSCNPGSHTLKARRHLNVSEAAK